MRFPRLSGATLRALRLAAGRTQEQIAAEIGITVSTWNRWEREHSAPSMLAARAISDYADAHQLTALLTASAPAPSPTSSPRGR